MSTAWSPPEQFAEFVIERRLGAGSMGEVFLARDRVLDRRVAIKFVGSAAVSDAARERFYTEARAIARLAHPNVVGIHRVGELARRPYLVAEYIEGTPLDQLPKPVSWERAVSIVTGLARGLSVAHRRDVLHRDIKPANIILGAEHEAKLLDFGLAALVDAGDVIAPRRVPHGTDVGATVSVDGRDASRETPAPSTSVIGLVGTPLYMAPEVWRGENATRQSDLYSLGVVLYELLAGRAPRAGLTIGELRTAVVEGDPEPIASRVIGLPSALAELVDRCLARDPTRRPASAGELCAGLEALVHRQREQVLVPYRGLAAFQAEHCSLFFGRDREIRQVVDRVRADGFVLVGGDSGAGKSSLCRAGVLPVLAAEMSPSQKPWLCITIVPGRDPLAALRDALGVVAADEPVVLLVDQLEEVLTVARPEAADAFARALIDLAGRPDRRVLATARSDFLGRLAALDGFDEVLSRALVLLGPLSLRGLQEAIVAPARLAGCTVASALVEELVRSGRASLPLLQFALAELWEARDDVGRELSLESLAKIGGVEGALARHADRVMQALSETQRALAWRMLLRLTTADGTRAVATRAELVAMSGDEAGADHVIERLIAARLLAASPGVENGIEVIHEALLTHWPRLRDWRQTHDHDARFRDQLAEAARRWVERGKPRGLLWRDDALNEYRAWRRRWAEPLSAAEIDFARAAESDARRGRIARTTIVATIVLATVAASIILFRARSRAERERNAAEEQRRVLLADQAMSELEAGHNLRAFAYLVELVRSGVDTPGVRYALAQATRNESRLHRVFDLPAGPVTSRWNSDGKAMIVADRNGGLYVWSVDGTVVKSLQTKLTLDVAAIDASGRFVAFSDTSAHLHLWDIAANRLIEPPAGLPSQRIFHIDIDRTSTWIAADRGDGMVTIWNIATGDVRTFGGPGSNAAGGVAFVYGPDRVIAGASGGVLYVWRLADGALTRVELGQPAQALLAVTRDGHVAALAGAQLSVWPDGDLSKEPRRVWVSRPNNAGIIATDATIAVPSVGGFEVYDTKTLSPIFAGTAEPSQIVRDVQVAPDRAHLATASDDMLFRVWDVGAGRLQYAFEASPHAGTGASIPASAREIRYSPDGRMLLTTTGSDVRTWRVDSLPQLAHFPHPNPGRGLWTGRWSRDGKYIAQSGDMLAELRDVETGAATQLVAGRSVDVAFAPDSRRVLLTGTDGYAEIKRVDGTSDVVLTGLIGTVVGAFDPTGAWIATADDAELRIYTGDGHLVRRLGPTMLRQLRGLKWTRDGSAVVICGYRGMLQWRDVMTGWVVRMLEAENTQFLDFDLEPRGQHVATANHDGTVMIWNIAERSQRTLVGHQGPATVVEYSPDGGLLVTGAEQGGARIWDPIAGRQVGQVDYGDGPLGAAWSPDGGRLLLVGFGADTRIIDMRRDARSLAELERELARDPWHIVDGRLVRVTAPTH